MLVNYPTDSDPTRVVNVTADRLIGEDGKRYLMYNWSEAEIAAIEDPDELVIRNTFELINGESIKVH